MASDTSGLPQSWSDVHARLRDAALADKNIDIRHDTRVGSVGQDTAGAWVGTSQGDIIRGDVVVGADGHRSTVRRVVAPDHPDASFAGYVVWLGVADEADLPVPRGRPRDVAYLSAGDGVLLGYPLPGRDGSTTPGRRRLGWAWFDATRNDLLAQHGSVVDGVVRHSMAPGDVPTGTLEELAAGAGRRWEAPWSDAIRDSVTRGQVTGTPIAEYVPERLATGRIVLVGDAAHVPTPMTGTGFTESLLDAETLADVLAPVDADDVEQALQDYERRRLPSGRDLVTFGQEFSRDFVRRA
jgi:2-polyprenyl-6-methoxyphenol hydroxylase-like FAD-dependent oxidoreductase